MANNLFITFDVRHGYRQGSLILGGIEELGEAVRISYSTWYVRSVLSATEAATRLRDVMDDSDLLVVVNCSNNEIAMLDVGERASRFIEKRWYRDTLKPLASVPATYMEDLSRAPGTGTEG
jgi:hypothetical protein